MENRIKLYTIINNEIARYETFEFNSKSKSTRGTTVHQEKKMPIPLTLSRLKVHDYLKSTNLDKHLRTLEKLPQEFKILYEPFPEGLYVPKITISPTKNELYLFDYEFEKAKVKPQFFCAFEKGLQIVYPFLRVDLYFKPQTDNYQSLNNS